MSEENKPTEITPIIDESIGLQELESNIQNIGQAIADEPEPDPEPEEIVSIDKNSVSENEIQQPDKIKNNTTGKKGRGRPKKSESKTKISKKRIEEPEPIKQEIPQSDADSLILLLNGTLIPIGSKIFNKKAEECQITDPQMTEIIKLRPESQLLGKSWLAYFGAILGTAAANFVRASDDDKVLTVIHAVKKMTPDQRIEVRNLLIGAPNE